MFVAEKGDQKGGWVDECRSDGDGGAEQGRFMTHAVPAAGGNALGRACEEGVVVLEARGEDPAANRESCETQDGKGECITHGELHSPDQSSVHESSNAKVP